MTVGVNPWVDQLSGQWAPNPQDSHYQAWESFGSSANHPSTLPGYSSGVGGDCRTIGYNCQEVGEDCLLVPWSVVITGATLSSRRGGRGNGMRLMLLHRIPIWPHQALGAILNLPLICCVCLLWRALIQRLAQSFVLPNSRLALSHSWKRWMKT